MCRIKDLHAGWFRIADPSVPVQSLCLKMTAGEWSYARSNSDFSTLFRRIDTTKKKKSRCIHKIRRAVRESR